MTDLPSSIQTRLATAGCHPDPETGAITPPIHPSTTFERAEDGSFPTGFVYSREANPTRSLFERTLADIEGAGACLAFSSGMAAANAVISAVCPGGHLVLPNDVYHGVRHLAETVWKSWGLTVSRVDYRGDWTAAIGRDTRLVWLETPSNPLVQITDIQAVALAAKARGIPVLADATWTTPLITRPLDLGADIVLHSTTKYLGGHSDALGGAILLREGSPLLSAIRHTQRITGAVMDPFTAWLTLRGMRSLYPRLKLQCQSAERLALMLAEHPAVSVVHYPSLASHPGHEIAGRQMKMPGAMLSFEVPGGRKAAMQVAARLTHFRRATSLGGTESLIEHRASIEPDPPTSPEGLLRISVGLESFEDLAADLSHALTATGL